MLKDQSFRLSDYIFLLVGLSIALNVYLGFSYGFSGDLWHMNKAFLALAILLHWLNR